jgi:hypothetical protein
MKPKHIPRDLVAAVLSDAHFRPRIAATNRPKKDQKLSRRAWKNKGEY